MKAYSQATGGTRDRVGQNDFYTSDEQRKLEWNMSMYLPAMAGVLVLGIGDSMASLIGVWLGRNRWFGTSRTVEGTTAAVISMFLFTFVTVQAVHFINVLMFQGALNIIDPSWIRFLLSTILTCLLEAFTSQIDNLFLPMFYYTSMILIGV